MVLFLISVSVSAWSQKHAQSEQMRAHPPCSAQQISFPRVHSAADHVVMVSMAAMMPFLFLFFVPSLLLHFCSTPQVVHGNHSKVSKPEEHQS